MTDHDFATMRHLREEVTRLQAELRQYRATCRENALSVCRLEDQLRALSSPARRIAEAARAG